MKIHTVAKLWQNRDLFRFNITHKKTDYLAGMLIFLIILFVHLQSFSDQSLENQKPTISFTFDDGSTEDMGPFRLASWNQRILDQLSKHRLKTILFSTGQNKSTARGRYVLKSWNDAGHSIANHTFSHPDFNSEKNGLKKFREELLRNDDIIKQYTHYIQYFRFPYLKEGDTQEKVDGFRAILRNHGYQNGHVTVDASDWYISSRLLKRLKDNPKADISGFRAYYKQHLINRALFYDSISTCIVHRKIHHVILLHHNLAAALFLDDLIQYFKEHGWNVIDATEAYQDEIYQTVTKVIPAGESLIWSMAKQTGKFEDVLRYPAEDGIYEKDGMDRLGL